MTAIYIDADACPVREETYRVATRLNLPVFVVSNGSRPIRPPGLPNVSMVIVDATPDAADDWIAERITAADVCVTADIPLAARCLGKGARAVAPTGRHWTQDNIGNALAGREVRAAHARDRHEDRRSRSPDARRPLEVPQRAGCSGAGSTAVRHAMNISSSFASHSRIPPVMPASLDTIRTFLGRSPCTCRELPPPIYRTSQFVSVCDEADRLCATRRFQRLRPTARSAALPIYLS